MSNAFKASALAIRYGWRAGLNRAEWLELVSLCILASCRFGRPTFKMTAGQAGAVIGRGLARQNVAVL